MGELGFAIIFHMRLYYENQSDIHIFKNSVFNKWMKHIEVDSQLVGEKIMDQKILDTKHTLPTNQLADLLTKLFRRVKSLGYLYQAKHV